MNERVRLADLLEAPLSEDAYRRIWLGVRRGREAAPSFRALAAIAVVGSLLGLLVLEGTYRAFFSEATSEVTSPAPLTAKARARLLTEEGEVLALVDQSDAGSRRAIQLNDGSALIIHSRAVWELLAESPSLAVSAVRSGKVTFDIEPGDRRWTIEVGSVTVEVIGTRFTIERGSSRVTVSVERGAVVVRGDRVPDGVQRLGAGEQLQVDTAPSAEEPVRRPSQPTRTQPSEPSGLARAEPKGGRSWQEHARAGDPNAAYATLGPRGVRSAVERATSPQELLSLADVARLAGHPHEAVTPLDEILRRFPDSSEAGIAAFSLGRLLLGQLGQPARAARVLERALVLGVPSTLRRSVYARLIEAYDRAGTPRAAEVARRRARQEFPEAADL